MARGACQYLQPTGVIAIMDDNGILVSSKLAVLHVKLSANKLTSYTYMHDYDLGDSLYIIYHLHTICMIISNDHRTPALFYRLTLARDVH